MRKDVIPDHLIGHIFEEQVALLLIHVQAKKADPASLQAFYHGK